MHEETLKCLESLREIPVAVRGLKQPMGRQLWRLLDLCDGGGLGFTMNISSLPFDKTRSLNVENPSSEMMVFYTGTFKVITSKWEKSNNSAGTKGMLLDFLGNVVIRSYGVFSDFSTYRISWTCSWIWWER